MKNCILAALGLFAVLAVPKASAEQDIDCNNAMTQMEMTVCAQKDWQAADAELNAAYQSAMQAMGETDANLPENLKGAKEALRDAQRTWIPYRDNACTSYGFLARGGSMEPMLIYSCQADLTRKRTAELNELVSGLGN